MLPSYIAPNQKELFEQAPEAIKDLIKTDVKPTTTALGETHKIPVGMYVRLSNIISFILIGALKPEDVTQALQDMLQLPPAEATKIADDLEHTILEKARVVLSVKEDAEVKTITLEGGASADELRKAIMDTTKRDSAIIKSPITVGDPNAKKPSVVLTPGSRSQLLEQLQIIGSIPNDEEIENRLKSIHEQIESIKKQEEDNSLNSKIALKSFMFGEKGKEVADPMVQVATYSVAPTDYNVDPYREIAED